VRYAGISIVKNTRCNMKKLIKDYKLYLDHIEKLSKDLDKEQMAKLKMILRCQLSLLITLKKGSNLGEISIFSVVTWHLKCMVR